MIRRLAAVLLLLVPGAARADFHIIYPDEIDLGEIEIEHNGAASFDHLPANSNAQSYTLELGTGLTAWWHSELELGADRAPGPEEPLLLQQVVTENTFLFTEPGEYWADVALYVEYGQSLTTGHNAMANEITFGPAIAKDIGRTTTTLNLFLTRQLGPDQTSQALDFTYAAQTRWNIWQPLSPAVEIYGDTGGTESSGGILPISEQLLLVGPVAIGSLRLNQLGLGNAGTLKYELGWLFGATPTSPNGTLRWRLDLEIPF